MMYLGGGNGLEKFLIKTGKSILVFCFISVLLSSSVERVSVSRMLYLTDPV